MSSAYRRERRKIRVAVTKWDLTVLLAETALITFLEVIPVHS
jgi:hypothetical protein